jgi:hypothetical protein
MRHHQAVQTAGRSRCFNKAAWNADLSQVSGHDLNPAATPAALSRHVLSVVLAAGVTDPVVVRCPVVQDKVPPIIGKAERQAGANRPPSPDPCHQHRPATYTRHNRPSKQSRLEREPGNHGPACQATQLICPEAQARLLLFGGALA